MKKLILFDIDGTLVDTGRSGEEAMLNALGDVFGQAIDDDGYSMSGKTDLQILLELMERHGVSREDTTAKLPEIWPRYVSGLDRAISTSDPTVLPRVPELVESLSARKDEALMGLLTGNVEEGAWIKLRRVGLDGHFSLGAFGDAAPERRLLPQIAVDRARDLHGKAYAGKDIVIIGDTPNDVLCGRELGVRAIAVATGKYTMAQLTEHEPDAAFEDFRDTDAVVTAILE